MAGLSVLSFGGGVQSTTLALMAQSGVLAAPDLGVFADTGCEPAWVYETLRAVSEAVSFPMRVVGERNLMADSMAGVNANDGEGFIAIPAFVKRPNGDVSLGWRQCTNHYKIRPIERAVRAHLGVKRLSHKMGVEMWLGITTDEIERARTNKNNVITNRYPLLDAGLSRTDCQAWLAEHWPNIPVGKSSCVICPYRSDAGWVKLSLEAPEAFSQAVECDTAIRYHGRGGEQFLHRSGLPLAEAVAMKTNTASLFGDDGDGEGNECEGGCFL